MTRGSQPASAAVKESRDARRRIPMGPLLVVPALVAIAGLVIYPVGNNIQQSFTLREAGKSAYAWMLENPVYLVIVVRTVVVAAIVTAVCVVIGYPFAYLVAKSGPRMRAVLLFVIVLPMWTSSLVRVFSWLIILQPDGIAQSILGVFGIQRELLGTSVAVTIAMTQILLPFAILPMVNRMMAIDSQLTLAAKSLGARPARAFASVFLPLSMPGVQAGALIVFIMSLGFYIIPALLGSPSDALLSQIIYQQVSSQLNFGRGGALATVLLAVLLVVAGGVLLVRRTLGRNGRAVAL